MSVDDQHSELLAAWEPLRGLMDNLPERLQWDGVVYQDVTDMADRVRGLASHLSGVVELSSAYRYESALALTRTCLEQVLVDWLVFLGRTFVQRISGIDEATWVGWQAAKDSGAEWTRGIRAWTRTKKGEVRLVREGLNSEPGDDGEGRQISIYHFLLEQYEPNLGPPSIQTEHWASTVDELRRRAIENEMQWRVYLTWSSLLTNLRENHLVDDSDAGRLEAHYRFLSGFAHPVVDHRRELFGARGMFGWPRYDHYSSELVLLYAINLGAWELSNFGRALDQLAAPRMAGVNDFEQAQTTAAAATDYFWFLGTRPHAYDTWKERNERAFREGVQGGLPPDPPPEEVRYPTDPLRRLIALHSSSRELLTGLTFTSPWPRTDADFR